MRRFSILVLLVGAVVVAACSSGSPGSSDSVTTTAAMAAATTPPASTAVATTTAAPTTTVASEPVIAGADVVVQTTPTSGGGTRPLLEWEAVDGAALYFVNIYTETGGPYWSAVTEETNTYVGGPLLIPAGRSGPTVADGYTWVVYAQDSDGNLLAASPMRSIAP